MKASSVWGVANVVLFTSGASHSLGTTQPRATGITPLPQHGASFPKPTPLPRPDYFNRDLVKKTVAPEKPLTMMIGHDNICGWLSGRDDDPYACKVGDTCGLILAQTTSSGAVMCFNKVRQTYDLVHACIDSSAYYSSSACDSSCVRNTFTSKCTNSSLPYCMTYAIFGDVTDYRCHSVSEPAQTVMASYTFDHRTSGKYWYGSVKFELPFFEGLRFTEIPYNFPTQEPIQDSRKTPVGAIVSGVVGGVAAIGAGFLIIFFCLRRRKKRIAGTTEASPSSNQVPLQSMAQNQDPAFYDSHSIIVQSLCRSLHSNTRLGHFRPKAVTLRGNLGRVNFRPFQPSSSSNNNHLMSSRLKLLSSTPRGLFTKWPPKAATIALLKYTR
ncbi:hypothetical protein E4U40_006080 [Claviceps sp. LM458 group G5]|nr:hypothetical protein E4U40_006080 [Claviceps sp. LM458 group G5]